MLPSATVFYSAANLGKVEGDLLTQTARFLFVWVRRGVLHQEHRGGLRRRAARLAPEPEREPPRPSVKCSQAEERDLLSLDCSAKS